MKQEIPPLVPNETKRLQPFEEIRRINSSDQTREIQDLVNTQGLQCLNRRVQSFEEYRRMQSIEENRGFQPGFSYQGLTCSDRESDSTCITSSGLEYR